MRKLYLIAVLLITSFCSYSQFINLPDTNFRNALIPFYPSCFNSAKQLDTSCIKQQSRHELKITQSINIKNLSGLEYINAWRFCIENNSVSILSKIHPSLRELAINNNSTNQLPDFSNFNNLFTLELKNCNLTSLPPLPPDLIKIDIRSNNITTLGNLNIYLNLGEITCSYNKIGIISVLPPNLGTLNCNNNLITQLSNLPTTLINLQCSSNSLTNLNNLPSSIETLACENNQITQVNPIPQNLRLFYFSNNNIDALPAFGNRISVLIGNSNKLRRLPPIPEAVLKSGFLTIRLNNNLITQLPNNLSVRTLWIKNNPIVIMPQKLGFSEELDLSNTLISYLPDTLDIVGGINSNCKLFCDSTPIIAVSTNFVGLKNSLRVLSLANTKILNYDFLGQFLNLEYLNLEGSSIKKLPFLNSTYSLKTLSLINTQNLYCLPSYHTFSGSGIGLRIYVDTARIKCVPDTLHQYQRIEYYNSLAGDSVSNGIYLVYQPRRYFPPFCSPINNTNDCDGNTKTIGNIYYDINNNNIKDTNENFASGLKVSLSNGYSGITDINGRFKVYAQQLGTYTFNVQTPSFFNAIPNNFPIDFNTTDTIVNLNNIALQVKVFKDSLSTKITPINWAARPGFVYPYLVQFKNVGSTTINATTTVWYTNLVLTYDSSSNNAVTNTGSALNLNLNNFTPGRTLSYIAYFKVKPDASLLGTVLKTYSTINGGTASATDSTRIVIAGSYDPNDKLATPQLSTTQVAEGQFINYTVRFQNTGTDTAFTVVIADTLNSLLQANTFEFLGSSHACKTTIQDNKLYFEFRNILLPDSTTNLIGSNGFVNFRIKPVSSVVLNTVIPNKAAIYFDYNEPIITNTATTTISNTLLPTHLLGFNAALQSNKTVLLYWNTTNELNTQFFVVEQSTNAKDFEPLETVFAKGSGNNSYYTNKVYSSLPTELYYRLKTIDKDGSISYSNIIKIKQAIATGWSIVTNPAKGKLLIEVKDKTLQNTQARLVNAQGQVVQTINVQIGFNSINVSNLNKGLYYVQTNEGTKQVVVE